ncbi:hypothetical protein GCM10008025_24420 [Ornithinibacillus halotolerans]|uniref:Uncharacterized protein n=1 Tax=Ornithinibacillus halotolerans TaxID=1274357 RepID=A0A916WAG4_9BACI|nr:hypothetical protein GCM10008025_24420 [Ornithinibacillus halotolerans]
MDKTVKPRIERLLYEIGYFDLEFQSITTTLDKKFVYEYIGYIDAPIFIKVLISKAEVEVMDCYLTEKHYVQSKKLSIEEFIKL